MRLMALYQECLLSHFTQTLECLLSHFTQTLECLLSDFDCNCGKLQLDISKSTSLNICKRPSIPLTLVMPYFL